ncbi:MAG: hypothetical protein IPF54_26740 [Draconibacterium sp.]|nr:hypothetical protein [Draconibacterium sp.]
MNDAQNEVIAWWYGNRNYRTGIELLARYCKNKVIINTLAKQGKENFPASLKKLNYELQKLYNSIGCICLMISCQNKQGRKLLPIFLPGKPNRETGKQRSSGFFISS